MVIEPPDDWSDIDDFEELLIRDSFFYTTYDIAGDDTESREER